MILIIIGCLSAGAAIGFITAVLLQADRTTDQPHHGGCGGVGGERVMATKLTLEAAIIELNRLKTTERMDIDRERLTAAIDALKDAAQFRIKRKPEKVLLRNPFKDHFESGYCCSRCDYEVKQISDDYCPTCGQAIDWN